MIQELKVSLEERKMEAETRQTLRSGGWCRSNNKGSYYLTSTPWDWIWKHIWMQGLNLQLHFGNAKHHTGVLALVNTRFFCVSLTQVPTTPPLRAPVLSSHPRALSHRRRDRWAPLGAHTSSRLGDSAACSPWPDRTTIAATQPDLRRRLCCPQAGPPPPPPQHGCARSTVIYCLWSMPTQPRWRHSTISVDQSGAIGEGSEASSGDSNGERKWFIPMWSILNLNWNLNLYIWVVVI
jgi:hypothetical protein